MKIFASYDVSIEGMHRPIESDDRHLLVFKSLALLYDSITLSARTEISRIRYA